MPAVNGVPDVPLDADKRKILESVSNNQAMSILQLGDFLKALCQALDADGVGAADYEATFTP